MAKEVILTGLRSNAEFHLGNYLGAILPMVEMQKKHAGKYQLNMFIPDLHSFTTPIDHGTLYDQSLKNLRVFIAAGLDISQPDTYIYRQSYIPEHSELTWILDCFTYFGELSRMTEFKEKAGQQANVSVGLFNYPALMAADILLYGATWVPVGEDQRQHLELTRDLAERFNNKFGKLFEMPAAWEKQLEFFGVDKGVRIRSLKNPEKKMSKSVDDPAGTIMLTDKPVDAGKKIMAAATDSKARIKFDWENQAGVTNLLQILALATETPQQEINGQWEGKDNYGELKQRVADAVDKLLTGLHSRLVQVDEPALMRKLESDEKSMAETANLTLLKVQAAIGLRPRT